MYNIKALLASFFVILGVAILCTLGTWQVQRLHWKNDIIERLEAARENPQNLDYAALERAALDNELPLTYGTVKGRLLSDKELLVGPKTNEKSEPGYHLITPLQMRDGVVLVNRGWVPESATDPGQRKYLRAPSTVTVTFTGIARRPDKNAFTSGNNPAGDQWFYTDIDQIAAAKNLGSAAPLVLYAESANRKFDAHAMHPHGWTPRNKHLQYAIFWYGMAIVLAGFYLIVWWRNKKAA